MFEQDYVWSVVMVLVVLVDPIVSSEIDFSHEIDSVAFHSFGRCFKCFIKLRELKWTTTNKRETLTYGLQKILFKILKMGRKYLK